MNKHRNNYQKIVALIFCFLPTMAFGQVSDELIGQWVIDLQKTKENIIKKGPLSKNNEWLPMIILKLCVTTTTFEKETVTFDTLGSRSALSTFHLEPLQAGNLTYAIQTHSGNKSILTITFLSKENITIKTDNIEIDEYVVWKRNTEQSSQSRKIDVNKIIENCVTTLGSDTFTPKSAQ